MFALSELSSHRLYNYLWHLAAPAVEHVWRRRSEPPQAVVTTGPRGWWEPDDPPEVPERHLLMPSDILTGVWTLHSRFETPDAFMADPLTCAVTVASRRRRWGRTSPHGTKPHYPRYASRYADEESTDGLVEIETSDAGAYAVQGVPWTPGPAMDIEAWYRRDEAAAIAYWWAFWNRDEVARGVRPPSTYEEAQQTGRLLKGGISLKPRRISDWHYASGGRILCCPDIAPIAGTVDLLSVATNDRCPRASWPPPLPLWTHGKDLKAARIRLELSRRFGPLCAICKTQLGAVVDHDHLTGLVRGHLCQPCNGAVDACAHPDGCPCAKYLNEPPARPLALIYPSHANHLRGSKYQTRATTFQRMVAALGLPPGLPSDHPARA